METLFALALMMSPEQGEHPHSSAPKTQLAMMCFLQGEQQSGMNKICYYDCAGSGAAITIKGYQLCPMSINQ